MAFVKFSRGLISTYNRLSRKDPDTLYLVYENENSVSGSLYLGTKLISSVSSNVSATALSDLADVSISGQLEDGMLLQYNSSTGNGVWEAVPLSDIISGISSGNTNISIVEALNEINSPSENDLAVVGSDLYIYDGEDWIQLTNTDLADRISGLESQIGHAADENEGLSATGLYADLEALQSSLENVYTKTEVNTYVAEQIAAAQHLRYEVVTSLNDIDTTADEAEYTIYLVPKNSETNDEYDEYFVVDEELEKIGHWSIDLSNYVQSNDNRLLTNEQKTKLDAITLDSNNELIIEASQVGNLVQTIQANQLIKSVAVGTFNVTDQGQLELVSVPDIDLSGYVQTTLYQSEVGNLSNLQNRVSANSTLVDEINAIKENLSWQELQV